MSEYNESEIIKESVLHLLDIENSIRGFFNKEDISHIDTIICLIKSLNALFSVIEKKYSKNEYFEIMKMIPDNLKDEFTLSVHLCVNVTEIIEKLRD